MVSAARALLLGLFVSRAAVAAPGLLPATVEGPGLDAAVVARSVEEVARLVVKDGVRLLAADDLTPEGPGCLESAPCRARGMARLGVEELARVHVTGTGQTAPFAIARLTIWGEDGAVVFADEQALATDRDLRGLLTRAFDPARATARLDVTGLQPGDALLIDGLPSPSEVLLAAGSHTLVVLHQDGSRSTETVTLGFEQRKTFALPRRAAPGQAVWPPGLVPGVVGAGVGGVGLVGAGLLGALAFGGAPAQREVAGVGAVVAGSVGILGAVTAIVSLWPASNDVSSPSG